MSLPRRYRADTTRPTLKTFLQALNSEKMYLGPRIFFFLVWRKKKKKNLKREREGETKKTSGHQWKHNKVSLTFSLVPVAWLEQKRCQLQMKPGVRPCKRSLSKPRISCLSQDPSFIYDSEFSCFLTLRKMENYKCIHYLILLQQYLLISALKFSCHDLAGAPNTQWICSSIICFTGKCLLAGRFGKNNMSLEGKKCCWEIDNSGYLREIRRLE